MRDIQESVPGIRQKTLTPVLAFLYRSLHIFKSSESRNRCIKIIKFIKPIVFGDKKPYYAYFLDPHGMKIILNLSEYESGNMFFGVPVEPLETCVAGIVMKNSERVLDVGANIGLYSLHASRSVGKKGKVISIEPDPVVYNQLVHNLEINGIRNTETHNLALGSKNGFEDLLVNSDSGFNSLGATGRGEVVKRVAVKVMTLDSFAAEHKLKDVDFIKIDVEGFEGEVMLGGESFLRKESPIILCELSNKNYSPLGKSIPSVMKLVRELGYNILELDRNKNKVTEVRYLNQSFKNQYFLFYKEDSSHISTVEEILDELH